LFQASRFHSIGVISRDSADATKRCENLHSLNLQVYSFQTVSMEGFTPLRCANFVLKHSRKDQNGSNRLDEIEPSKRLVYQEKNGKPESKQGVQEYASISLPTQRGLYAPGAGFRHFSATRMEGVKNEPGLSPATNRFFLTDPSPGSLNLLQVFARFLPTRPCRKMR